MNIIAKNICITINGRHIVNNVSLSAKSGQMVAITGKSGSGKTSLLNCLGLIHTVDEGKIYIDSEDAAKWSEKQRTAFWRKHAAFIYQDYGIIDDESVAYNITLSRMKSDKKRVQEVLSEVSLEERENDCAVVLSGGEKQRLGLARALYKNASIIYADEPTASLDSENREKVISLLHRCTNNGAVVILATHDLKLAEECDFIVELN